MADEGFELELAQMQAGFEERLADAQKNFALMLIAERENIDNTFKKKGTGEPPDELFPMAATPTGGGGGAGTSLPEATTQYKVATVTDTAGVKTWIEDWTRAHA